MSKAKVHIGTVRLKNFLSFYEGIVSFDPGLTVIIGPNGSGKTSVFHAIKFALGSNQREERYSKWSDFVRHGATSAEVELRVNNGGISHKFLRRIDRDGIPKAYIDGKRVKAAELRRLVSSLGLDIDNTLVFMPQERINALREMNPIEVRRLVEEGTGLSDVRDRIALQETEVAQSRQKLQAALDESRVVERELELLKYDLTRLEKKRALKNEEKELEVEVKWATLDDISTRMLEVRSEIENRESGLVDVLDEQKSLQTQTEGNQADALKMEARLETLQREIGGIEVRIDEERRRMRRLTDESKSTVNEISQLERDLKKVEREKTATKRELERAAANKEQYLEDKREIGAEIEGNEIDRDRIEQELSSFEEWNTVRTDAYIAYKSIQSDIEKKDLLLRSYQERLQNEEAELQSIDSKWAHVWEALEETDEKELARRKGQLEREITSLNEQRFQNSSLVSQLQKEIDDIRVKLAESSERIPTAVRELKDAIADHKLRSITGPLVEILMRSDELSNALEAVFSGNLPFAFIVSDPTDYSLMQKLRDKVGAPSPIIMLNENDTEETAPSLPSGKGIEGWLWDILSLDEDEKELFRRAFGDIVLTSTGRVASRVTNRERIMAVSRDGSVVDVTHRGIISYPRKEPTGLVSTAPLQTRLLKIEKELVISRKKVTEIMEKLEKAANEREEVLELQGHMTRWSSIWDRRKKLSDSIPDIQEKVVGFDDEVKDLQLELGKAQRELRKLDSSQPPERSRLVGQRSAVRLKLRKLQGDLSNVESGLHATERDEDQKRAELKSNDENIEILSGRIRELKDEMRTSKGEAASISELIETLELGLLEANDNETKLKEELGKINEIIKTITERLVELNLTIKDNRLMVLQAQKQLRNMEEEEKRLHEDLAKLVRPESTRLLETARQDLLRVRHLLDDYNDVSESVAHTETRLKDRLSELIVQVDTLKVELFEAEATVKHIRDQYHNGMNATLSRVEKNVNRILATAEFAGRAKFILTLKDGIYGVEFKSRIKGDDFGEISQGSGGERSLIAIALILALQRFNPAPTYALDEVDIFLDATNTESVSRLLYDASRRSQFILFTPAKSTHLLKHADKRIGVVSPGGTDPSVIVESPKFSGQ
ncbi:MAG: AAA family ATPase [Candidatus Thorarchaeota archaeon]|jgi:chromosome segregation protein